MRWSWLWGFGCLCSQVGGKAEKKRCCHRSLLLTMRVLDIKPVTFPDVANAILTKRLFDHYDRPVLPNFLEKTVSMFGLGKFDFFKVTAKAFPPDLTGELKRRRVEMREALGFFHKRNP